MGMTIKTDSSLVTLDARVVMPWEVMTRGEPAGGVEGGAEDEGGGGGVNGGEGGEVGDGEGGGGAGGGGDGGGDGGGGEGGGDGGGEGGFEGKTGGGLSGGGGFGFGGGGCGAGATTILSQQLMHVRLLQSRHSPRGNRSQQSVFTETGGGGGGSFHDHTLTRVLPTTAVALSGELASWSHPVGTF